MKPSAASNLEWIPLDFFKTNPKSFETLQPHLTQKFTEKRPLSQTASTTSSDYCMQKSLNPGGTRKKKGKPIFEIRLNTFEKKMKHLLLRCKSQPRNSPKPNKFTNAPLMGTSQTSSSHRPATMLHQRSSNKTRIPGTNFTSNLAPSYLHKDLSLQ